MLKLELKNLVSEWLSRFVQSPEIVTDGLVIKREVLMKH